MWTYYEEPINPDIPSSTITIIAIVACVIIAIIFIGSAAAVIQIQKRRKVVESKEDKELRKIQYAKSKKVLIKNIDELFDDYDETFKDIDPLNTKVSDLNKLFKDKIMKIIDSSEFEIITRLQDEELIDGVDFLRTLSATSAANWRKKYGDQIKELYGR